LATGSDQLGCKKRIHQLLKREEMSGSPTTRRLRIKTLLEVASTGTDDNRAKGGAIITRAKADA